jgi:2-isopropylmalate synthase
MSKYPKYVYPEKIPIKERNWPDRILKKSPVWCSVDLRDGNQALPIPMNPEEKLEYFKLLIKIGFKEIEVGFPSASQDDFDFVRKLIEDDLIPSDVRISVLTQAREPLIAKTVESLKGANKAIVHLYVATSDLHGRLVFKKDRKGVLAMAVKGTEIVKDYIQRADMSENLAYEFSAEEFTDSDIDFAIDVCKAVKNAWGKSEKENFILNLPATVERRPPYQYADMIEYFKNEYPYGDETTISIHAHNDQGCAVAASEMALLAGAERVEGTLFGHGERTGNVDLITLALNIYARGIETGLDFSDINGIIRIVETASRIPVHERHPYAGNLVFTAFSGSHQDAIMKGINSRDEAADFFKQSWKVPYLHIDPADVGREYERLIRINSQSGKGGAAYLLEHDFGYVTPKGMHPAIGAMVQKIAEEKGLEVDSSELLEAFKSEFLNVKGPFELKKFEREFVDDPNIVKVHLVILANGREYDIKGTGNGPISATVNALKMVDNMFDFVLDDFIEQSLGHSADAKAIAYVAVKRVSDDRKFYGAGEHVNIDKAAVRAVFAALNRAVATQ